MQLPSRAPAYAFLVPLLATAARRVGYALAVHGSMQRDLDLLAAPWTDEAADATELLEAIFAACAFTALARQAVTGPTQQPHGRLSWAIPLDGGVYLDLSVMPRREAA